MKEFTKKYLTVLALVAFGFLGGFLYPRSGLVNQTDLIECQKTISDNRAECNEIASHWQDNYYQCTGILRKVITEVLKKEKEEKQK